ncbi:MAG: hypothetical protein IKL82_04595 [Clostridia bacterium]|nr:hypothetical protein [Clostridia bacterium]
MIRNKGEIKVHFIGVGGAGMSVLAKTLIKKGFLVSGSDIKRSALVKELEDLGLNFLGGHAKENVINSDVIVYSSAIKDDNVELAFAKRLNKAIYSRAELLDLVLKSYKISVGIAGSHGKTTATCMLASALDYLNLSTLSLMGGNSVTMGNFKFSRSNKSAISEICEFDKNLKRITVTYPVVLNVDSDHLDTYKTIDSLADEFYAYLKRGKVAFINQDDARLNSYKGKKVTFGINSNADYTAKNVRLVDGKAIFSAYEKGRFLSEISLNVYGECNVYNALSVIAVLRKVYKVKANLLSEAIKSFKGVKRRFEEASIIPNKKVIFDYCHHPTEIASTIKTSKKLFGEVLYVFEPHTYSRTKLLYNDFLKVFKGENVIIYKTYPAREKYVKLGSSKTLATDLNALHFSKITELKRYLESSSIKTVVIMGAGELYDKLNKKKDR